MQKCSKLRKQIALLAVNALAPGETREVQAHLDRCEACRAYSDELQGLAVRIRAAEPTTPRVAPDGLHSNWVGRVRALEARISPPIHSGFLRHWRMAGAGVAAATAIALFCFLITRPGSNPAPVALADVPTRGEALPQPTVANYQSAVSRSLDAFDDLTTRHSLQPIARAPVYTASSFAAVDVLD